MSQPTQLTVNRDMIQKIPETGTVISSFYASFS